MADITNLAHRAISRTPALSRHHPPATALPIRTPGQRGQPQDDDSPRGVVRQIIARPELAAPDAEARPGMAIIHERTPGEWVLEIVDCPAAATCAPTTFSGARAMEDATTRGFQMCGRVRFLSFSSP